MADASSRGGSIPDALTPLAKEMTMGACFIQVKLPLYEKYSTDDGLAPSPMDNPCASGRYYGVAFLAQLSARLRPLFQ